MVPLLAAGWLAGCASHGAPDGFLAPVEGAGGEAWGGWIELSTTTGLPGQEARLEGELIAVSPDSLWVLTASGGRAIPTAVVTEGEVTGYDAESEKVAFATVGGVISTVSNGAFLFLTAPMWIIGGTFATRAQAGQPVRDVSAASWEALRPWARFPQGLPPGVELSALRRRPGTVP